MALLLKNGAVFLHVPKTGGNFVTRVLNELDLIECRVGRKHADMERTLRPEAFSAEEWKQPVRRLKNRALGHTVGNDNFKFCFVRNPLSWLESWFKYMRQPSREWRDWGKSGDKYAWHPNAPLSGLGSDDFNQMVRNIEGTHPGYVTSLFALYATPAIDFVGRQESLVDDLLHVFRETGLKVDEDRVRALDRVGVSPRPKEPIVWDAELRAEVERLEYAGLVRFGYTDAKIPPPS